VGYFFFEILCGVRGRFASDILHQHLFDARARTVDFYEFSSLRRHCTSLEMEGLVLLRRVLDLIELYEPSFIIHIRIVKVHAFSMFEY